ncbi:MAG: hypothetical protein IKP22_08350 [Clostridia bacterium]|nr:hypothetical protein [Clostridia bacterium]
MKRKHPVMNAALLFLAAAMLPVSACAINETTVIDASDISADMAETDNDRAVYLPDAGCYAVYENDQPSWADSDEYAISPNDGKIFADEDIVRIPCLTAGERRRADLLLERFESGEISYTGESVLNRMKDVAVGVYTLDPADYDGESLFVILPSCCLSDDMLLAVIDAWHQAGKRFDPSALDCRNCMRGGGIESSRFLTEEEGKRSADIRLLISRGMITGEQVKDVSVPPMPALDPFYHCGLEEFTFLPYRRLTDMEIAAKCFIDGAQAFDNGQMSFDDTERRARTIINEVIKMPLGMKIRFLTPLTFSASYVLDMSGEVRQITESDEADGSMAGFDWTDADLFGQLQIMCFVRNDDLIPERIRWFVDYGFLTEWHDEKRDYNAPGSYVDSARAWAADHLLFSGQDALDWSITGENVPYLAADCAVVTALTDEWIVQVMVCRDNLKVCDVELYRLGVPG